ncbi:MAG: hypothetical protein RL404_2424 [Pseudomonadota bacterium]
MQAKSRLPSPYRPEVDAATLALREFGDALDWTAAMQRAEPWICAVRDHPPPFWAMETLLHEYPLTSDEGKALMRLAEALLRIPDADTAMALTADQLAHLHEGGTKDAAKDSALARLSSNALSLSQKLLRGHAGTVSRLGARAVVAAALRAVQLLGRQFVLGENMPAAAARAQALRTDHPALSFSFDMLGEGARCADDAQRHFRDYRAALSLLAQQRGPQRDGISVKLSALHPRYEALQYARVMDELLPRLWMLCEQAAAAGLHLTIDAEESDRLELSLEVFEALLARIARQHAGWQGFGLALQAYQTRALPLVGHVIGLARHYRVRLMCRLVKGAYWDAEIKRAQELGLPHYPVFTHKHHTDLSYLACARALLDAPDVIYPQLATHNAATIAAIVQIGQGRRYELGRLHGMGEGIYREVLRDPSLHCRIYAPVGRHRDLLAYLVRRLLENGANSSFVHQLHDDNVDMAELLTSPLHADTTSTLPLPRDIFQPDRRNSEGLDLAVPEMRAVLERAMEKLQLPHVDTGAPETGNIRAGKAVAAAQRAFEHWSATDVVDRALGLQRAGDLLQERLPLFSAALVREGRKTWNDAVAEVRETIDFLRYYATEGERLMMPRALPGPTGESNTLQLRARGIWACISPWNFPLAIFTGQVAAALVTGNTVVAKPAEQAPRVALMMQDLLRAAGLPDDALQLLIGDGEVGAALVAHPAIAGVAFTGSTVVAKGIQRALANKDGPIIPLVAETGGINAMLVDSTALPEQVVDAVIQSVYRSAGQRCSSLRVLCVHDAIADALLAMLVGAIAELRTGPPDDWRSEVGPVIDAEAYARLQGQVAGLSALSALPPASTGSGAQVLATNDYLVFPQLLMASSIADIREEIFGPVLQVVRWSGDPLHVIRQLNALGYGLTLGIQTRIDSRAQQLANAARVGNVYVNRGMTGAVVGVQPFGGEGLSGTGPKAGGPYYLPRFCSEQTVTINLSAAGGDIDLMSGGA